MTIFNVTNTTDLVRYAGLAQDGDVILLDPGTYSGVSIQNIIKTGNVTISSLDPSQPAVLTDLIVKNCQGLTFSQLEMFATTDMPFQVLASSRINLDQIDVHGTLNNDPTDDVRAMIVRSSSYVNVTNSYFHEVSDALSHTNDQNITFSGNRFDLIRDNGISGGGSSFVTLSGNVFTSFDHIGAVHPDAIQFWTSNTNAAATDITITGNVFDRGTGVAVQGIFLQDEIGNLPYQRVNIADNVIVGAIYNGIAVRGAVDATLSNNIVIGEEDQISWISLYNVAAATLAGNISANWSFVNSNVSGSGDIQATPLTLADAAINFATLSALAQPGQLAGVPIQYGQLTMFDVTQLGYTDTAPLSGLPQNFAVILIAGTAGNDTLRVGTIGTSHLMGLDGNDSLIGSHNGGHFLEGGKGDDSYTLYNAGDIVIEAAGEGADTVYSYVNYTLAPEVENGRAMAGGLTIHGNALDNSLSAAATGSTLYGDDGNDTVQGAAANDTLYGGNGNDRLFGYDGNDRLDGGVGDDKLYGNNGNDTLIGGAGNDTFEGGSGADQLSGGSGLDTFIFRPTDFTTNLAASQDTITDFSAAQGDKIGLTAIDAITATAADDPFVFIGNSGFHGIAGELRYATVSGGLMVYGDTNGDRVADFQIKLNNVSTITSSAFIL